MQTDITNYIKNLKRQVLNPFRRHRDAVVWARYSTGFSEDLSSWFLTIDANGLLTQNISISNMANGFKGENRIEKVETGISFVFQVFQRANEINFWEMQIQTNACITDMSGYAIGLRDAQHERVFYAPKALGIEANINKQASALDFVDLWKLIHLHAPFHK